MIIGIGHKKQVGKDTGTLIIQYLTSGYALTHTYEKFLEDIKRRNDYPAFLTWQNKKFADGLKDILCLIIGCTREQLEDENFKSTVLSEEWWYYKYYLVDADGIYAGEELVNYYDNYEVTLGYDISQVKLIKMTPRLFLQLLGTECGREIIHPNIWVNMLMKDYKTFNKGSAHDLKDSSGLYIHKECTNCKKSYLGWKRQYLCKECIENYSIQFYPNWIISDVRFPSEVQALRKEKSILIKINRTTGLDDTHKSESALDYYDKWDYTIDNNGTIEELIEKIREILIKEKII